MVLWSSYYRLMIQDRFLTQTGASVAKECKLVSTEGWWSLTHKEQGRSHVSETGSIHFLSPPPPFCSLTWGSTPWSQLGSLGKCSPPSLTHSFRDPPFLYLPSFVPLPSVPFLGAPPLKPDSRKSEGTLSAPQWVSAQPGRETVLVHSEVKKRTLGEWCNSVRGLTDDKLQLQVIRYTKILGFCIILNPNFGGIRTPRVAAPLVKRTNQTFFSKRMKQIGQCKLYNAAYRNGTTVHKYLKIVQ